MVREPPQLVNDGATRYGAARKEAGMFGEALALVCVFTLVMFLIRAGYRIIRRARRGRRPREQGITHECFRQMFRPYVMMKPYEVSTTIGLDNMQMFQGIFCSLCQFELFCESCCRTPQFGELYITEEALRKLTSHCCATQRWSIRSGHRTRASIARDSTPLKEQHLYH